LEEAPPPADLPITSAPSGRLAGLDLARGLAVALMFLVHTVKGLLAFEHLPAWGLVPVQLVGQAAPALFALVFGLTSAWVVAPQLAGPGRAAAQRRLLTRGLWLLALVELLTLAQLFQFYPWPRIAAALAWQETPDFVGVLRFYALAVLVLPLLLPRWHRLPRWLRLASPVLVFALGRWLAATWRTPGLEPLRALLVEVPGEPAFGLLTHGAVALLGLALGERRLAAGRPDLPRTGRVCLLLGLGLGAGLVGAWAAGLFRPPRSLLRLLTEVAMTWGKHPPGFYYTAATLGAALLLLGLALQARGLWLRLLAPLGWLGREALFAFALHVLVIFVGYRYLAGLRFQSARPGFAVGYAFGVRPPGFRVGYGEALLLWLALLAVAAWAAWLWARLRARRTAVAR